MVTKLKLDRTLDVAHYINVHRDKTRPSLQINALKMVDYLLHRLTMSLFNLRLLVGGGRSICDLGMGDKIFILTFTPPP